MGSSLNNPYEKKIRPCIDLIDSLRIEKDLSLPAITVIGDQGSGKSSVLEALTGVALPRGSGIVTRCPLELKLIKAKIGQGWSGKISYSDVMKKLRSPSDVEDAIINAQNAIAGNGLQICEDFICLEIISTNVPDLTLIDLPGIARVAVGDQPRDIGDQIKKVIQKYIKRRETINLVVMPCNVDIATTEALAMAREVDLNGERTLGILTKPDLIDKGTENYVMKIMSNSVIPLKKGYKIVKCRGQQDISDSLSVKDAIQKEESFFKDHKYFSSLLDEGKATIPILAEALTTELVNHIYKSLPDLKRQINSKMREAMEELEFYRTEIPESEDAVFEYLMRKISNFTQDICNATKGEEKLLDANTPRLFRTVRNHFENWQKDLDASTKQLDITLEDNLKKFDSKYRGRELPGYINYQTFEMIVRNHIQELRVPALESGRILIGIVEETFLKYSTKHFGIFHNLDKTAKTKIENLRRKQEEITAHMIETQFAMENHLYVQDKNYCRDLLKEQQQDGAASKKRSANDLILGVVNPHLPQITETAHHVKAYCSGAFLRLSSQIPMILYFCALHEYGDKVGKAMFQILQDKTEFDNLLEEQPDFVEKRMALENQVERLGEARKNLLDLSG
ncbi:interferon-induced GTP-binding protein Mx3 [Microcaecilia unicolor]|uniref:Interferon-induced GTP-binding protein Mx3-like n=1 Tax=Microcaecilia unicolor TaxID=1415580 RepID=A0A6P7Y3I9_9AMPH|nr:interferon-induced GTP-binding protein Mx3-like [Microcaecilia unicolor]